MPVIISEPSSQARGGSPNPNLLLGFRSSSTYFLLALLITVLLVARLRSQKRSTPLEEMPSPVAEKDSSELEDAAAPRKQQQDGSAAAADARVPEQEQEQPPRRSSSPVSMPLSSPETTYDFDSFEPSDPAEGPPRRRSYTKMTTSTEGVEVLVNGEIVVAEGWRRHTRVFGGGVCKACEESERRMKK